MMDQPSVFVSKPTTLDFLGLGEPRTELSALLTSLEGGFVEGSPASYGEVSGGGTWNRGGTGDQNGPSFL